MIREADIQTTHIDGDRYHDRSIMQLETDHIWRKTWLLAALESDLRAPKSNVVFDIGHDSIIIARTADGFLSAYHNACTHRGTRLLAEGVGTAPLITCPYHAWCFNLDGSLRAAPDAKSFSGGLPPERLRLKPVKLESWKGFVFVNMDMGAATLSEFLGTLVDRVSPYNIADMALLEDQSVSVDCNWKAMIDNFSELYHVDHIHPQHKRFVDCPNATDELFENGHTGLYVPGFVTDSRYPVPDKPTDYQEMQLNTLGIDPSEFVGKVAEIPAAIIRAKREQSGKNGYDYSALSDEQLTTVFQFNLFPNIILSGSPEGLWMMRSRPHPDDPSKSLLDKWALQLNSDPLLGGQGDHKQTLHAASKKAAQENGRVLRDCFGYEAVLSGEKSMTETIDQDISLLARVQAGAQSSGFASAWLSNQEIRVAHFHDTLNMTYDAARNSEKE
ncbi:aromatic ring-hydroxylating dioxygenase subunit alpha [Parasphingorhabdus sp.]|uniref:aromatic ring-hydroxylating oxygenase subunit alpha n=1 Tax=Parasphingorhabdus sp. TaxID=2709688 RepID=UPI0030B06B11|nr:aromatic ring-hydroxylating dioxygenase subunit alpha [Sphingomonadales bacterium]